MVWQHADFCIPDAEAILVPSDSLANVVETTSEETPSSSEPSDMQLDLLSFDIFVFVTKTTSIQLSTRRIHGLAICSSALDKNIERMMSLCRKVSRIQIQISSWVRG